MPFMPRTHRSVSSTLSVSLCLALAYALILTTICAPFVVPKVSAATHANHSSMMGANNAASPSTASLSMAATAARSSASTAGGNNKNSGHREGELIVRFRSTASEQDKTSLVEGKGGHRNKKLRGESSIEKLTIPATQDAESAATELRLNPNIEFVEPNYLVTKDDTTPNDPTFSQQWALHNSLNAGADINVMPAWDTTTGSASTVIAVIDSGIDFSHPDLINNEWTNSAPSASNDTHGWDYIADSNIIKDEQGHGTAIAGIIAAEGNNGAGTAGVMWHASLMSLRVLDSTGTGDIASAVEAIDYAAAHGASVINLSWGTDAQSTALADAIERAGRRGVVVVCSAGNAGRDIESTPYYPASYGLPNMVSVAATDASDRLASWSNYGSTHVTIAAPGVDIQTTKMTGGYWTISGTSASAPLVAGVAGLVKTARPWLSASDTVQAIASGARRVAALSGKVSTVAIVNAQGALLNMTGSSTPPPGYVNGDGGGSSGGGSTGNGGGSNNGNGNGNAGGSNATGNGNTTPGGKRSPRPHQQQEHGSGGTAADGSFNVEPTTRTKGAPLPNLPNIDALRRKPKPAEPKAPAPIPSKRRAYSHADNTVVTATSAAIHADSVTTNSYAGGNLSMARLDAGNRTGTGGEDLFSGNFNWSVPLVSLAGRAGLDLGFALSYNSLVWTKAASNIYFDADSGSPSPGFRLGLPVIQSSFYNDQAGSYAYMLVTASGARVELRQVNGTNVYDAQDSSNLRLVDNGNYTLALWAPDGTRFSFSWVNGQYQCTEIKDRNGNFITVNYNGNGRIANIIDTLARVINFNYDGYANLISITQTWNGQTHQWATFGYGSVLIQPNFSGVNSIGPNNVYITALTQVGLGDGSRYNFEYNSYGQVSIIRHYAPDSSQRNYVSYALPANASDCPRVTERHDWAGDWNNNTEAVTSYSVEANDVQVVTFPDGTLHKEFFNTAGWARGLNSRTEEWAGGTLQKWTTTDWTQDNIYAGYQLNPRPSDTNIYDNQGNRKRKHIDYTSYGMPSDVYEYAADGWTVLRRTHTDYRWDDAYVSRRIIGLPSVIHVYEGISSLASEIEYHYDWADYFVAQAPSVQHDAANYPASFTYGRGNLVAIRRFNKDAPDDTAQATWLRGMKYNMAGAVVSTQDILGHQTSIGYADSFSDGNNSRNILAYPTTVTDPDGYQSTVQYNYDMGAVTRTQDPKGAATLTSYDGAGRVQQVTNAVNNAYRRYNYGGDERYVETYTTMQEGAGEAYQLDYFDGVGRSTSTLGAHPGSVGGYRTQVRTYNVMGRMVSQTNPTEMNSAWTVTGDDAANGWVWNNQAYDWKGRPTVATHGDGTTTENIYGGCGCAGGEVVTARDEMGRRTRATADALGRIVKTEVLNWDQSVYSTTTTTYNVRDQVTRVYKEAGTPGSSGTGEETLLTYDGYGRLATKKTPIESYPSSYVYNADDTLQSATDARGASANYGYNGRKQVTGINYGAPAGVVATAAAAFGYDEAGNRTWMTDGTGRVDYQYDQLSRLRVETKQFNGLSGSFPLTYDYNLSGELKSITDPFGSTVNYGYDTMGQLSAVTGTGYAGVSQFASDMQYRAWGALKHTAYGNGRIMDMSYNTRLQVSNFTVNGVMGVDYQYNADGRVRYSHNLLNGAYDRSYVYDHAGRLSSADTGSIARGLNTADGPYSEGFHYDVYGNMTGRDTSHWSKSDSYYTSYVNERDQNTTWSYDASGNAVQEDTQQLTYDAAGRQTRVYNPSWPQFNRTIAMTLTTDYDGDGQRVKQSSNSGAIYYVRSSILGGQSIADVYSNGQKEFGYIYANGKLLARQEPQNSWPRTIVWVHENPSVSSERRTNMDGSINSTALELDPLGANMGLYDPFADNGAEPSYVDAAWPQYGNAGQQSYGCSIDGISAPCNFAAKLVNSGAGARGPLSKFKPAYYKEGGAFAGYKTFRATADGYSGWLPPGATYNGGGNYSYRAQAGYTYSGVSYEGQSSGHFQPYYTTVTGSFANDGMSSFGMPQISPDSLPCPPAKPSSISPQGALAHYVGRSGKDLHMPINQVAGSFPTPPKFPEIQRLIKQGTGGAPFVSYSVNNTQSPGIQLPGKEGMFLGRVTYNVSGVFNVYMTGDYQFYGSIGVNKDPFDFHASSGTNRRDLLHEVANDVGELFPGVEFNIVIDGRYQVDFEGNSQGVSLSKCRQ